MKKKIIIGIIVAAAVCGLIAFRFAGGKKVSYVSVKTSTISQGDVKAYLSTTGTVKSKNTKDYYPLQGKVKKVNVKVGDSVKQGQVLVEYEVQDVNAAVKQAQIQYDNAALQKKMLVNNNNDIKSQISDLDKQISDLDSQISNLNNQVNALKVSKNPADIALLQDAKNPSNPAVQIQNAEASKATLKGRRDALKPISTEQFKQADNSVALAQIALDSAKSNLSKSQDKIISDIDGVVTAINVAEGATSMTAGVQSAVTVQDLSNLKVELSVGKYDSSRIQLGQDAVVKNGGKDYKSKVSEVDPAAKKTVSAAGSDTTLGAEVDILDKPEGLKVDFDADVDILVGQANSTLKVPAESIKTDKTGKSVVFIVEGDKAVQKEVKLGIQSDMEAQVIEGVKAGDKVILNPGETVKDGAAVKEMAGDGKK
ncbi:efflux RND transporter periplasmic adaptor subunit [Clostridium sp. YIM B02515]|uniref:Efflux RND transporter periplasmic adaptor subunit n=1 Tax=Clostridium rhizosphaerae TaxID=2803861 RepID=A0ABS1T9N0_9CLOT|nr:biotin/lipoyl-binding protein [Clostridium rhizosphaerae]MBL4936059.1 efflux RND transporter periplasmic adaptor subunit [Clostridium rhizosphaerae]